MTTVNVKQVLGDAPVGMATSGDRIVKWLADRDLALAEIGELELVSLQLLVAIEALHEANSVLFHYGAGGSLADSENAQAIVDETVAKLANKEQALREYYKIHFAPLTNRE